jgi:copper(I)-binding protein
MIPILSAIFKSTRRFTVKFRLVNLIALVALALGACSGPAGAQLEIEDPWVRAAGIMEQQDSDDNSEGMAGQMPGGSNSAAYMTIKNSGNEADRLLSVDCDFAEAVEMHISEMKDGVMTMHQVDGIDVPAKGQAELKPGGLHVMLIGLKRELKAGDMVVLTLNFEKSGLITANAEIRLP